MDHNRLLSLDFTRGVAIILVVWAHADIDVLEPAFYAQNLELVHRIIYSFHLALFFIISAALLKKSIEFHQSNFSGLLKKITKNILIPFYSLGIAFLIIRLLTPNSVISNISAGEMIKALFINQFDIANLPSGVLWFLFSLFIFAILVYILVETFKINPYVVLTISFLLNFFHPYFNINYFGFMTIPLFFIYYAVGYIYSSWVIEPKFKNPWLLFPVLFLTWFLSFTYLIAFNLPLSNIICGIAASFLIIGLSMQIQHSTNNKFLKFIYICGSNSIIIYIFHTSFFVLIKKALEYINLTGSYFGFGIAVAGGVILPLLLGIFLSNFRIHSVLLGRAFYKYKDN